MHILIFMRTFSYSYCILISESRFLLVCLSTFRRKRTSMMVVHLISSSIVIVQYLIIAITITTGVPKSKCHKHSRTWCL